MTFTKIDSLTDHFDFIIYCAGFEDRSNWIIHKAKNLTYTKAFLLKYKTTVVRPTSEENEILIENFLNKHGTLQSLEIDPLNPISTIVQILKNISEVKSKNCRILFDISVMSKQILFLFLRGLFEYDLLKNTQLIYTEPADYKISASKLSFGASKHDVIPTFEGMHNPKGKRNLIILLGYEGDRAFSLWEKMEPHNCILCYPEPPYKEGWFERTRKFNKEIIGAVGDTNLKPLHSRDPSKALQQLEKIISDLDPKMKNNCLISPMGTKPQSVAAFYYYLKTNSYPNLIYGTPTQHGDYSQGIGDTYILHTNNLA